MLNSITSTNNHIKLAEADPHAADALTEWEQSGPKKEQYDRSQLAEKIRDAIKYNRTSLHVSESVSSLPPLPAGLERLEIDIYLKLRELPPLPKSLQYLAIENYNGPIPELPDGLQSLLIRGCETPFPKLPEGLKKLEIQSCKLESLPPMPSNLLELKLDSVELKHAPELPDTLSILELNGIDGIHSIPSLPNSLDTLKITYCNNFTSLPNLPDNLSHLQIQYNHTIKELPQPLPSGLKTLTIDYCKSLALPIILPQNISDITMIAPSRVKWEIAINDIPNSLKNINIADIEINPKLIRERRDIKINGRSTDIAADFESGDLIYGLARPRQAALNMLSSTKDDSKKEIRIQNDITNSVWERGATHFNSDEEIRQELMDSDRAIQYKNFLLNHKKYNVTERKISAQDSRDQGWIRTSKAGLEFQTQVRNGKVLFCVDHLIDSIPEIAKKQGDYGRAITASELRWLYRNKESTSIKENVQFYLQGKPVSQEYVFSLTAWNVYQPKKWSRPETSN
ncbi:hypothetical protein ACPRNU_22115 [Chromobacterium vaccinii]|uniref:hypothetical protein n=1 Tax=Chromobacterium vaccinii TaxID=1108595 RepID=UPI003C787067